MTEDLDRILEIKTTPAGPGNRSAAPGPSQSAHAIRKARKTFRGMGATVIILALITVAFLGHADDDLAAEALAAVGLCVLAGIWHLSAPSIASGVAAGVSLAILGIFDLFLAGAGSGMFSTLPALIDFAFALKLFAGCASYAKAMQSRGPRPKPRPTSSKAAPQPSEPPATEAHSRPDTEPPPPPEARETRIRVKCPNPQCARALVTHKSNAGRKARCKSCGTPFMIPES